MRIARIGEIDLASIRIKNHGLDDIPPWHHHPMWQSAFTGLSWSCATSAASICPALTDVEHPGRWRWAKTSRRCAWDMSTGLGFYENPLHMKPQNAFPIFPQSGEHMFAQF